ncbi:hypothetical protein B0H10DRAFT_2196377, partial [Mycena sp. CBHHK59/15]
MFQRVQVSKGKAIRKEWSKLPPNLIRRVATFILVTHLSSERPTIHTTAQGIWFFHTFMSVCVAWGTAVETHSFWDAAIDVLDPVKGAALRANVHNSHTPFTPYIRFLRVFSTLCLICRVNLPLPPRDLGIDGHDIWTPMVGWIRACPEHHGRQLHFCGLCLRDSTSGIFPQENEDKVTWPGVIATCSACRLGGISTHIPGVLMYSDSDVRLAVLEFVSRSHGSIACVSRAAFENHWLQTYTKIEGMRQHAVAAALYSGSPLDMQNIVSQVRDLAVKDWVRARLVQGCWLHPSDVQWSPARSITNTPEPPGHGLEQELGSAYDFHLRRLLLEPMRGMVKILIHKAQADGVDPSLRCARVGLEDVVEHCRNVVRVDSIQVPITLSSLGQNGHESFKALWREACAPVYLCLCPICTRTNMATTTALPFGMERNCPSMYGPPPFTLKP